MTSTDDRFEQLFRDDTDPWRFRTRWYEARKRALTLACLPQQHYGTAYEPGCANGELAAALAPRCGLLLASDGAEAAVALARERLRACANVRVFRALLPQDWPDEQLDLLVVSELGYFLDDATLDRLAQQAREALLPGGTVLACHWRHPFDGAHRNGDDVHAVLAQHLGLPRLLHHIEDDLVIDVWCQDPRSVAQREFIE